eukprot:1918483-Amphidinium_carterae.1
MVKGEVLKRCSFELQRQLDVEANYIKAQMIRSALLSHQTMTSTEQRTTITGAAMRLRVH